LCTTLSLSLDSYVVYKETEWLDGHVQQSVWEPVGREFWIQNLSLLLLRVLPGLDGLESMLSEFVST